MKNRHENCLPAASVSKAASLRTLFRQILVWLLAVSLNLSPLSLMRLPPALAQSTNSETAEKSEFVLDVHEIKIPDSDVASKESYGKSTKDSIESGAANSHALPLAKARLDKLVALMPPFASSASLPKKFEAPTYTRKPPPLRNVVKLEFPPKEPPLPRKTATLPVVKPLHVTRISPSGAVANANSLTIVFDQPMVPVTVTDVSDKTIPVKITPQPLGKWRWLNTSTLEFTPAQNHFPLASTFYVEISGTTKSLRGAQLAEPIKTTFDTAEPIFENLHVIESSQAALRRSQITLDQKLSWKAGSNSIDPLRPRLICSFNQQVDKDSFIKSVHAIANGHEYPLALVPKDSTSTSASLANESNEVKRLFLSDTLANNSILIEPLTELPKHSTIEIIVDKGLQSLEGSKVSKTRVGRSFTTYQEFLMLRSDGSNFPGSGTSLNFNNPIDVSQFSPSMITVNPAVDKLSVKASSSGIFLEGRFEPYKTYIVTLSRDITDIFGQHLSGETKYTHKVILTPPVVQTSSSQFRPLMPGDKQEIKIWSLNTNKVTVYLYDARVEQWERFRAARTAFVAPESDRAKDFAPFELISSKVIAIDSEPEIWKQTLIDLSSLIKEGHKHIIAVIDSPDQYRRYAQWLEYAPVTLNTMSDNKNIYVMANSAETGKPMVGGTVTLLPGRIASKTDATGLARLRMPNPEDILAYRDSQTDTFLPRTADGMYWSTNSTSGQFAWYTVTDRSLYRPGDSVSVKGIIRWIDWDNDNERTKLKPKTVVNYKVHDSTGRNEIAVGSCEIDSDGSFATSFVIPRVSELGDYSINLSFQGDGKFDSSQTGFQVQEFRRPEFEMTANSDKSAVVLGDPAIVSVSGRYRTGASMPSSRVHWRVRTGPAVFNFSSTPETNGFHFGGGLYSRMFFGRIGEQHTRYPRENFNNVGEAKLEGITNHRGDAAISVACKKLPLPDPISLTIEATMEDLNRQDWSKTSTVVVHPSELYAGLKLDKSEYNATESKKLSVLVCDLQSRLVADSLVDIELTRAADAVNAFADNIPLSAQSNDKVVEHFTVTSQAVANEHSVHADEPGSYWLTAKVRDKLGRVSRTIIPFYVRTSEETLALEQAAKRKQPTQPKIHQFGFSFDKQTYHPGEIAQIKITSDALEGHGFLFVDNTRIRNVLPFKVHNGEAQVTLLVKENHFPNSNVYAKFFGSDEKAFETFTSNALRVQMEELRLNVDVHAEKETYQPGENVRLLFAVKDGKQTVAPNAQISVAVVDESLLALNGYTWHDPSQIFSNWSSGNCQSLSSNDLHRIDSDPEPTPYQKVLESAWVPQPAPTTGQLAQLSSVDRYTFFPSGPRDTNLFQVEPTVVDERHYTSGRSEQHQQATNTAKLRSDFNALAYFNPSIHTDRDGTATATFKVPGNLTKYRIMAIAVCGEKQFGTGENTFTTSLPLMVTPSLPRFLNFDDECDLSFLVQNKTNKAVDSELVVRARNLSLDDHKDLAENAVDATGRSVSIPAQGRVEVRVKAKARTAGEAVVQVADFANDTMDAAETVIPLQPAVTTEAYATSGQIDDGGICEQISLPPNVVPQVGGLKVTASSTAMQYLADASLSLQSYPFACSEQLSSRIIGLAALESMLTKFPDAMQIKASTVRDTLIADVNELRKRQRADGSFGLWKKDDTTLYPFASIQCTKALWVASQRGIAIPEFELNLAKSWLRTIQTRIPSGYGGESIFSIRSYALNVMMEMGETDAQMAHRILQEALAGNRKTFDYDSTPATNLNAFDLQEQLYHLAPLEGLAWLMPVLASNESTQSEAKAVLNIILSHVSSTNEYAELQDSLYGDDAYRLFYSHNRLSAVVLEALISSDPKSDLIPKMVNELLTARRNGSWRSTQENSHVLQALSKYFDTFESQPPNFLSQLWLGDGIYSEQKFEGRSLTSKELDVPMEALLSAVGKTATTEKKDAPSADVVQALTLAKEGTGRMYYRVELKYAPKDLKVPEKFRGFEVTRNFAFVDSESDVSHDSDGNLKVKAGALVKVTLNVKLPGTRHFIALVDSLPAGFEVVNQRLIGNRALMPSDKRDAWWHERWIDHENLRDNRVEIFADNVSSGSYNYTYYARATALGSFIIPPCKVEEMYNPETFGRTKTEFLTIN